MTLKLCGFSASNYYNKVKLQLLEKGVPFEEELVWTGLNAFTLGQSAIHRNATRGDFGIQPLLRIH